MSRKPGHHRCQCLPVFVEHHEVRDTETLAPPLDILGNLLHTADEQVRITSILSLVSQLAASGDTSGIIDNWTEYVSGTTCFRLF